MSPEVTAAVIAASVGVLTLIGTLAAQYLGRRATSRDTQKTFAEQREQLDKTFAEQREQLDKTLTEQRTQTWNERFATAADQLGSDKPAVQLAGVYAMAGLADDWEESRQTCVDVLCGYLRMPYEPDPGGDAPARRRLAFQSIREVRHTVISVITAHLRKESMTSWRGLNFNFTGVVFDGGDFTEAKFTGGTVRFVLAEFCGGTVSFHGAKFSGSQVDFNLAVFSSGQVNFNLADFSGGKVDFRGAKFTGSQIDFNHAVFSGGTVDFDHAVFSGGTVSFATFAEFSAGYIGFGYAKFSGSTVDFTLAKFCGGTVSFNEARFSAGLIDFASAQFSGSAVYFRGVKFTGGQVSFEGAEFSGGKVRFFGELEFSGGKIDFSDPGDWAFPPAFPWTGTPPPGVKLPKKEDKPQE